MDEMRIGVVLMGVGAVVAGVVGVLLPPDHRLGAVLSLVTGAGVGVGTLAVGIGPNGGNEERVFLVGALLGLLAEIAVLTVAWSRSRRQPPVRPGP
jgi:hypothetical protein